MAPTCRVMNIPKCRKIKFTNEEDQMILDLVGTQGENANWEMVSRRLETRTPRQCKDRYHAYLAPGLNKNEFSAQEDQLLLDLVKTFGKKWKSIAPSFIGRPEIALKNRYKLLQRRQQKSFDNSPESPSEIKWAPGEVYLTCSPSHEIHPNIFEGNSFPFEEDFDIFDYPYY